MAQEQTETTIKVSQPDEEELQSRGVTSWPIWTKETSQFDWSYDDEESCYFLEGDVTVKTQQGEVRIGKGDFVTFPKGLSCQWIVHEPVRKHYRFG